ncbi:tRNA (mnm(5)s(2)U34)-methyltransferase [Candidatus Epulonipiscium viviparus]|uniref:tRNA (mnm(5)s(2)U34)-methyltransferase n=1 Tax=Candidatus Epulonipiscium viviparus TaxID=420336 RepID=UPI00016BFDFE|nr:class I SAM-dependent methyltransferase [Candidatus Epulopiscium viviparus]
MILKQMLDYAKFLLTQAIAAGDSVVDATCGNGNDTLFLANLVGAEGKVYAFDIQDVAIAETTRLLAEHNIDCVQVIKDGHEVAHKYMESSIAAAIFNLGYLPKGDHSITTQSHTTITAVDHLLDYLKPNGIIVLVVYHGHSNGKLEKRALRSFCQTLDQKSFSVLEYKFLNQKNNAPFIIAIEKL